METIEDPTTPEAGKNPHAEKVSAIIADYQVQLVAALQQGKREDGRLPIIIPPEVTRRGLIVVDPGVHGAFAFVGNDGDFYVQPFAKSGPAGAFHFLREKALPDSIVVVESVSGTAGQSPTSAFTMGSNVGHWEMLFTALDLQPIPVLPAVWQKAIPRIFGKVGKARKRHLFGFAKANWDIGSFKLDLDTCDAFLMFIWVIQHWYSFATVNLEEACIERARNDRTPEELPGYIPPPENDSQPVSDNAPELSDNLINFPEAL